MPAILFGSISALADTSELQRASFNRAFTEHGLDWKWERLEYQDLLTGNGGAQRIADYAAARGETVDAEAVHATKSRFFQESLGEIPQLPRPGVSDTIHEAHERGWKVGLVTTTSQDNVDAVLRSMSGKISKDDFSVIVSLDDVDEVKPDPAAYTHALEELGEDAGQCVAVEDNVGGVAAARAAGLVCVAFANTNTGGHDYGDAPRSVHLAFDELVSLVDAA